MKTNHNINMIYKLKTIIEMFFHRYKLNFEADTLIKK